MSIVGASEALAQRGGALSAHMPLSNAANGNGKGRAARELARRACAELAQLEVDYHGAVDRGLSAQSREGIDAAFDEADRLQRRLFVAIRHLRALDELQSQAATADDDAQASTASADRRVDVGDDSP